MATFQKVTRPSKTDDGQHAPALPFGVPRVMAVLAALVDFYYLIAGFTNRDLVVRTSALLDGRSYTSRHATYDLRRLRRKGLINRIANSNRYQLTSLGRRIAVLFSKTYGRVLTPGITTTDASLPPDLLPRSQLARAWHQLERTLQSFVDDALTAA